MNVKISIIIPTRKFDQFTKKCIEECEKLNYENYEIIVLPDDEINEKLNISTKIKIIPTGKVYPSIKKNIGIKYSEGEICAFIDSDAYPDKNWLKNGVSHFLENEKIVAIGGPNLTPQDSNIYGKLSGLILSSFIFMGKFASRHIIYKPYFPIELPSCNLLVKKYVFDNISYFPGEYLTGEDAYLCFKIRENGKLIFYSPDVIVYHHRRPLFLPFLKQIFNYGRDKSLVLKKLKLKERLKKICYYTIPSLITIFLILFLLSFIVQYLKKIVFVLFLSYFLLILFESIRKGKKNFLYLIIGAIGTHIFYYAGFIYGIFKKK
ncbi:MAG: glycosyltransferase [Candidatus Ratteibacteria bacterium]